MFCLCDWSNAAWCRKKTGYTVFCAANTQSFRSDTATEMLKRSYGPTFSCYRTTTGAAETNKAKHVLSQHSVCTLSCVSSVFISLLRHSSTHTTSIAANYNAYSFPTRHFYGISNSGVCRWANSISKKTRPILHFLNPVHCPRTDLSYCAAIWSRITVKHALILRSNMVFTVPDM